MFGPGGILVRLPIIPINLASHILRIREEWHFVIFGKRPSNVIVVEVSKYDHGDLAGRKTNRFQACRQLSAGGAP
jgi:hypothetical protein